MEPAYIAAIEIASSKIKGAVATAGPDGQLAVIAVEEIPGINNVRYGRVQNIREVSNAVNEIIRRLEECPGVAPRKIRAVAIGTGGRSLSAVPAKAALKFPHECEITENQIQRLTYEASRDFMGDKNIEATIPRVFYVNNAAVPKAVGTFGDSLRGEFMMVICGKETRQNLERIKFDNIEPADIEYILRPTAIADLVLTADERELGCALVDFGAETTTVSVYKDGTLAFLCVIPMGSRLITRDLMSGLGITEDAAENYKITLGTLAESNGDNANANADEVNAYVRARAGEIAANIINQMELSGVSVDSLAKIVLVGGGSKLPEFATQLGAQCKRPVRVASMPADIAFRVPGRNNADNIDIVALLAAAAKVFDSDCLTPVPATAGIAAAIADEPEESAETVEERTPATDYQRPRFYPEQETRLPDEDDDDLLDDDEDEEEEEEEVEETHRRFGLFGLGRRKNKEEKAEPVDDGYEDPFESDDEEEDYDDTPEEPEEPAQSGKADDHYGETTARLEKLLGKIGNIFKSDEPDDNY